MTENKPMHKEYGPADSAAGFVNPDTGIGVATGAEACHSAYPHPSFQEVAKRRGELLREAEELLSAPACEGATEEYRFCGLPAEWRVEWSDRVMLCCNKHLEQTKHHAAHDNISDRTDNPFIYEISSAKARIALIARISAELKGA